MKAKKFVLELSGPEMHDVAEALGMLMERRRESVRIAEAVDKGDPWNEAVEEREERLNRVESIAIRLQLIAHDYTVLTR